MLKYTYVTRLTQVVFGGTMRTDRENKGISIMWDQEEIWHCRFCEQSMPSHMFYDEGECNQCYGSNNYLYGSQGYDDIEYKECMIAARWIRE